MEQILDDFLEPRQSDYYAKVKKFKNGRIEGVLKPVRPMKEDMLRAAENYPAAWQPLRVKAAKTEEELEAVRQENFIRASRRAKQMIRHSCMAMNADRLLTLTVRDENAPEAKCRESFLASWKRFLRLLRKSYPEFLYVAVLELQQRGVYHMHIACQGWLQISTVRRCWYEALGGTADDKGSETKGQVDIQGPNRDRRLYRTWKTQNLAAYIAKYISKTFEECAMGIKRYFRAERIPEIPKTQTYWVSGTNMVEALKQFMTGLQFEHGLRFGSSMWLSDEGDIFWINGIGDT